jgi:hypothetical protein
MRRTLGFLLATVVATVVVGAAIAQAQDKATVDIGFKFIAAGKAMPAGKYSIEISPAPGGRVTLTGPESVILSVITRLGRHDNDKDPELVFDKVNGQLLLSEVWLSGTDGYLLLATKENHEHHVLGGSHPSK